MKKTLTLITFSLACLISSAQAADNQISNAEKDFISQINGFDKQQIIQAFGEPSKMEDLKTNDDKVVASIWQYHYINTNENGEYYQTTELDFLDDKVVMVVFMNNDGSEVPADAVSAPLPQKQ